MAFWYLNQNKQKKKMAYSIKVNGIPDGMGQSV
jgi:hypothetical protein